MALNPMRDRRSMGEVELGVEMSLEVGGVLSAVSCPAWKSAHRIKRQINLSVMLLLVVETLQMFSKV